MNTTTTTEVVAFGAGKKRNPYRVQLVASVRPASPRSFQAPDLGGPWSGRGSNPLVLRFASLEHDPHPGTHVRDVPTKYGRNLDSTYDFQWLA